MKHIMLIGNIDGHSTQLLRYASRLCKDLDLRLHILQIEKDNEPVLVSSAYYFKKTGFIPSDDSNQKKKALELFVTHNTKDLVDPTWISNTLVHGNIEHCLTSFINTEKIDLIIASQSVFRDSEIEDQPIFKQILMNVSELPTLIIPDNHSYQSLTKIAYLTTLKGDDYRHLQWIQANFEKGNVKILHFSDHEASKENQKKIAYLKSELGAEALSFEHRQEDIEDFVREGSTAGNPAFDLISLRTHKRNFWQRLIDPSTALHLILELDTPTLLFKYQDTDS